MVDAPPGTSDEHISIVQYLQIAGIDGAIIVTALQQVSLIDVRKEINFCKKVGVPILGVVENMSGLRQELSDMKFVKPTDRGEVDATEWALSYIKEKAPEFCRLLHAVRYLIAARVALRRCAMRWGSLSLGRCPWTRSSARQRTRGGHASLIRMQCKCSSSEKHNQEADPHLIPSPPPFV